MATEVNNISRAFCIHSKDNVATLLDDAGEHSSVEVLGASSVSQLSCMESIKLGHKIALHDLARGDPIIKFGVVIGRASQKILAGAWVHLHNCESLFDERSQTLELHTGAATDTKYE